MAVYSAVKGSNARIYIDGKLFCTARYAEIVTEQTLHEVYECFSAELTAIAKGRRRHRAALERLTLENADALPRFLALDNFTVKIVIDGKSTVLGGCAWSDNNIKIEADKIIERLTFSALERTEGENDRQY